MARTSRSCSCEKRNFSLSFNRLSKELGLRGFALLQLELEQLPENEILRLPLQGHQLDLRELLMKMRRPRNIEDPSRPTSSVMNFEDTGC